MTAPEPCPASLPLCWCGIRGCPNAAHLPVKLRFWHRRKHSLEFQGGRK